MPTTGDRAATDPTPLYRDLLAAIHDALDIPTPGDGVDRTHYHWLQRDRAQAVHAITQAVLDDPTGTGCLKQATEVLRERTRQLPVTYRRHIGPARDFPEDCQVCGPGCCSPVLGIHGSCPGPRAGAMAVTR